MFMMTRKQLNDVLNSEGNSNDLISEATFDNYIKNMVMNTMIMVYLLLNCVSKILFGKIKEDRRVILKRDIW